MLGSLSLSLGDTESVQQNETQRAVNTSLSHSHRDIDLGHQSSETVANDVARASVTCFQYYWQTFQICGSSDCCPLGISRNGVEGFLQIEQKPAGKTTATAYLVAWAGESLENIFKDSHCVPRAPVRE